MPVATIQAELECSSPNIESDGRIRVVIELPITRDFEKEFYNPKGDNYKAKEARFTEIMAELADMIEKQVPAMVSEGLVVRDWNLY